MAERVRLAPHPAKNKDGGPLFPMLRSIIADGYGLVGYTGDPPYHRIQFINWQAAQETWLVSAATQLVEAEFGLKPDMITTVAEPIGSETQDEDDE